LRLLEKKPKKTKKPKRVSKRPTRPKQEVVITIKNEFDKVLRAVAEPATQKIDDALKVLGIRRFQTEIKKILVQPD